MYRRGKGRPWLILGALALLIVGSIYLIRWMGGKGEPASVETELSLQSNAVQTPTTGDAAPSVIESTPKTPPSPATFEQPKIAMGDKMPATPAKPLPTATPPATIPLVALAESNASPPSSPARSDEPAAAGKASAPPPTAPPTVGSSAPVSQRMQVGLDLIQQNKPVEARRVLSDALNEPSVSPAEADRLRAELTKLNDRLVLSPEVASGDPFASVHVIQPNEALSKLPRKLALDVDWRFLQRINRISDPGRLQIGQRVKVIKGPFHAVVDKRTFRLDLYLGNGSERVYVRSFTVGLGEYGATPEGEYVVKANSKLVNPAWTNPRTGEHFASKDPKNPLGAYWIGLVGFSDNIRGLEGYGVHGTIEPDSIGQEKSMGCVRMHAEDIALMYEVLVDNASHVEIRGNDWP